MLGTLVRVSVKGKTEAFAFADLLGGGMANSTGDNFVALGIVDSISHETARQTLHETVSAETSCSTG